VKLGVKLGVKFSVNFTVNNKKLKMYRESKNYYICNMPPQINQDIFCPVIEGSAVVAPGYGGAILFLLPC
jgi:hypothetical protein